MELLNIALGVLQDDALQGVAQHATAGLLDQLNGLSLSNVDDDYNASPCKELILERFDWGGDN